MALLFVESFDHYATADLGLKWNLSGNLTNLNTTAGRRGSQCMVNTNSGAWALRPVTSVANPIFGAAVKMGILNAQFLAFYDGITNREHVKLLGNADGSLTVTRGTLTGFNSSSPVTLGTSAVGIVAPNVYAYIEMKAVLSLSATGSVVVRVNGVEVLNITSVITANTTTVWSAVLCGTAFNIQCFWDDLYIADSSGTMNNNFLGDLRVEPHYPNANGTSNMSTPSTGTDRYATVDELLMNSDTDYNTLTAVNDKDTYQIENLKATGAAILGVQVIPVCKKADAGVGMACPVIKHASGEADGLSGALSTGYGFQARHLWETNPATGVQFTEAEFNALEIGLKRTA